MSIQDIIESDFVVECRDDRFEVCYLELFVNVLYNRVHFII